MNDLEHLHQVALINQVRLDTPKYPELDLLYAVPNGGRRHIGVAKKLKAEGVKRGIPDLFLPVARGGYHGYYIEMKAPAYGDKKKGTLSTEQKKVIPQLIEQGYKVETCWDWQKAYDSIIDYLAL